jgi:hypothetical protein
LPLNFVLPIPISAKRNDNALGGKVSQHAPSGGHGAVENLRRFRGGYLFIPMQVSQQSVT